MWSTSRDSWGPTPDHSTASEIAVEDASERIWLNGKRSGASALVNGVRWHFGSYSTQTASARTLSRITNSTLRGVPSARATSARHRQRFARARAQLVALLGHAELRADQSADGVQVEHVRRRRLQVSVLGRNEKRRDQQQRRQHARDARGPAARAHDLRASQTSADRHEQRRRLRRQVVADVGKQLVDDAVHEVRGEQRNVDVQVRVVLLVEVLLAAERERRRRRRTAPRLPSARRRAAGRPRRAAPPRARGSRRRRRDRSRDRASRDRAGARRGVRQSVATAKTTGNKQQRPRSPAPPLREPAPLAQGTRRLLERVLALAAAARPSAFALQV